MGRRPLALLFLLALSCGKPPPPPPPPPPLPVRLAASKVRLQKLAEEQLAAAPQDEKLRIWVAAFKGAEIPETGGPLAAFFRGADAPEAVEAAVPGSSYASLFRAEAILRKARGNPNYGREAAEAVEEALKRDRWECLSTSFRAWAHEWLETQEPDVPVRVCYRVWHPNAAPDVVIRLAKVAQGLAFAPAAPKLDTRRLADVLRRLIEERLLKSPRIAEVIVGNTAHEIVLEAQFLTAWRQKDLETARAASVAMEEWGRRDAAIRAWSPGERSRLALDDTIRSLEDAGALVPPLGAPPKAKPGAEDAEWRQEALKEVAKGAKAYWQALRGEPKGLPSGMPERSPRRNYLGYALRDREILFNDPFPKDRHEQLLEAAFAAEVQDVGTGAYAWVILDNLLRPGSIPSAKVAKRFDDRPERDGPNLNIYAVLKLRKEDVGALKRPDPAAVRKAAAPSHLQGYCMLLRDVVKAKPQEALEWLGEADGAVPSAAEVMIAETLRGATEKDFGPDWPRWKAYLETGN